MRTGRSLFRLVAILFDLAQDVLRLPLLGTRSSAALKAENISDALKTPAADRDIDLHSSLAKMVDEYIGDRKE